MAKRTIGPPRWKRNISLDAKFLSLLSPEKDANGCRLFLGSKNRGYGQFQWKKTHYYAHRYAYERVHGPIPPGMQACHKCDVRACAEEGHLFLGTIADNLADMDAKGRRDPQHGERGHSAKLTNAQAAAIRSDSRPQSQIAKDYGVSQGAISFIKRGITFREHLENPALLGD